MPGDVSPFRSFDPRLVGTLECRTWECYYRHKWAAFLVAAIRLVRHTFGFSWPQTLRGAWWVLRANQAWAPYPDNRPDLARARMHRFYALLASRYGEPADVGRAADLEVEWWRVHREAQHAQSDRTGSDPGGPDPGAPDRDEPGSGGSEAVTAAVQALYAYVYSVPAATVRLAAAERARAMVLSDEWVRTGSDPSSALLRAERGALIRSYAALLAAVYPVG